MRIFQFIFAFTTAMFEIPPEYVTKIQTTVSFIPIDKYQTMLIEYCKFFTLVAGRGLFYIFQGNLWFVFANLSALLEYVIGAYLCFIGLLHVLMHFGVLPQTVAAKMRSGYSAVAGGPPGAPGGPPPGGHAPYNPGPGPYAQ